MPGLVSWRVVRSRWSRYRSRRRRRCRLAAGFNVLDSRYTLMAPKTTTAAPEAGEKALGGLDADLITTSVSPAGRCCLP